MRWLGHHAAAGRAAIVLDARAPGLCATQRKRVGLERLGRQPRACRRFFFPAVPHSLPATRRRFGGEMDRAIAKSKSLGVSRDEFRQIIREKLFVAAPGQEPRIASYGGRAPLAGWLRVVCARAVIDSRAAKTMPAGDQGLLDRLPSRDDPELAALRARHAEALPVAFAAGLAALAPRQRNLLRQRYLHNVSAASLAQSWRSSRHASEWQRPRAAISSSTRKRLKGAVEQNLDSLLGLLGASSTSASPALELPVEDDRRLASRGAAAAKASAIELSQTFMRPVLGRKPTIRQRIVGVVLLGKILTASVCVVALFGLNESGSMQSRVATLSQAKRLHQHVDMMHDSLCVEVY
jgi:RNA polymerase sigma-70 factor